MNAHDSIRLPEVASGPEHPLMKAMRRGLPITLLVDLIDPNGPRSHEMFEREGKRADADVLVIPDVARAHTA
jgi:hypothetical protein